MGGGSTPIWKKFTFFAPFPYAFQMILTALAPRLIQSISRNVHKNNRALKQLCAVVECRMVHMYSSSTPFRKESIQPRSKELFLKGNNMKYDSQNV